MIFIQIVENQKQREKNVVLKKNFFSYTKDQQ